MAITIYAPRRNFTLISTARKLAPSITLTTTNNWVDEATNQIVDEEGNSIIFNSFVGNATPTKIDAPRRSFVIVSPAR